MKISSKIHLFKFFCKKFWRVKNWFLPTKENNFQPSVLSDRAISIFILLFLLVKVIFSFNLILVKQSSLFADISAQRILSLTNEIRQQYGLPLVKEDVLLDKAAQYKAQDMLKNKYFGHFSPTGTSPWYWIDKSGYNYYYAGENLAMNFLDSEEVIKGWLNSPSHRENLLNKNYKDMGIAVVSGDFYNEGINRILVVQMFGSKAKPFVPVAIAQAPPSDETPIKEEPEKEIIVAEDVIASEEVLKEDKFLPGTTETTGTTATTIQTIIGATEEQPQELIEPQVLAQKNILSQISNNTRNQVGTVNKVISGFIILLGLMSAAGIILRQRTIAFGFSELVLRSAIIIVLGISFTAFHLENLVGHLMIP